MSRQNAIEERMAFSARLKLSLASLGYGSDSPTAVAREFNRLDGNIEVTIHAVRKWLMGEAIPTQAKLRVLAAWLGVSMVWLRYGAGEQPVMGSITATSRHTEKELLLLTRLQSLDEADFKFVADLIRRLSSKVCVPRTKSEI